LSDSKKSEFLISLSYFQVDRHQCTYSDQVSFPCAGPDAKASFYKPTSVHRLNDILNLSRQIHFFQDKEGFRRLPGFDLVTLTFRENLNCGRELYVNQLHGSHLCSQLRATVPSYIVLILSRSANSFLSHLAIFTLTPVKVTGSNPGNLLKYFVLYSPAESIIIDAKFQIRSAVKKNPIYCSHVLKFTLQNNPHFNRILTYLL
jgi:hypothetical protein